MSFLIQLNTNLNILMMKSEVNMTQRQVIMSYELTMPNVNSWNGKWSGASNKYYLIRKYSIKGAVDFKAISDKGYFYHDFGDGWGAGVKAEIVESTEAKRRAKITAGFSTYQWMVDNIEKHGRILTQDELRNKEFAA